MRTGPAAWNLVTDIGDKAYYTCVEDGANATAEQLKTAQWVQREAAAICKSSRVVRGPAQPLTVKGQFQKSPDGDLCFSWFEILN